MKIIKPGLLKEVKQYGAFDITSCFNCGNCTAVCPLSKEDAAFPRKLIRYAQVGLKDDFLNRKEMWLCFYCGTCSETCPREADPGAFMAAARRMAIASNDFTGLTGVLYKHSWFNFLFLTAVALLFALFMYANRIKGDIAGEKMIAVFHIPLELIHNLGLAVMAFAVLILGIGICKMIKNTLSEPINTIKKSLKEGKKVSWLKIAVVEFINVFFNEMWAFKRYQECDAEDKAKHFWQKPWFYHALVAWGFMGLFAATGLDYLFKDPAVHVPLWYPIRLLGTISGISLMAGTTIIIIKRLLKSEKTYADATFADWFLILILWFIGCSGFVLEFLNYFPQMFSQHTMDVLFLIHVAPSMEIVVLIGFTKLAHVFYRSFALFGYYFNQRVLSEGKK